MGLIGAARADAPAPAAGFAPIEVSADIDAELTSPVAAAVDTHIDLDTDDLLDDAQDVLEDLGKGGASYYGPNLAGNRTASGERFDPTQLTAAHRTLPMGSKVKVTHNGKSVIVRINDRGPFHGNRVIDLSTAAAKKIGLFRAGTRHRGSATGQRLIRADPAGSFTLRTSCGYWPLPCLPQYRASPALPR